MTKKIEVKGTGIRILTIEHEDYISLTDMLKAKDGYFFISDWLRNRNTVEFLGIWERVYNPNFNYGEFAIIKSQAGLNSYRISVKNGWKKPMPEILLQMRAATAIQADFIPAIAGELQGIQRKKTILFMQRKPILDSHFHGNDKYGIIWSQI